MSSRDSKHIRDFLIFTDIVCYASIPFIALFLRTGEILVPSTELLLTFSLLPLIILPALYFSHDYHTLISHIGFSSLLKTTLILSAAIIVWSAGIFIFGSAYPRGSLLIAWMCCIIYFLGSRALLRYHFYPNNFDVSEKEMKIAIYGSGTTIQQLIKAFDHIHSKKIVAVVSDDPELRNSYIGGNKVQAYKQLPNIISRRKVDEIILANPSLSRTHRNKIISDLEQYAVRVRYIPSIDKILSDDITLTDIKEIEIDDLLERDAVPADKNLLTKCISNKTVLVTGGGGSIGSELCRQVAFLKPSFLIILDNSEYALYKVNEDIENIKRKYKLHGLKIVSILGSVTNEDRMNQIFDLYKIHTVYHAAAYKHVPIVEHNMCEGITTNTFGTKIVAEIAQKNQVLNFVLISTDKAVRPANIMGGSKRLAEMILQNSHNNNKNKTTFSMVRFGNVMGSSGSVIPLFREQIQAGGPVTVTHKEITRYFMTINEAVSLVIQAGSMAVGGDVFILNMGAEVKIDQLARKMIRLSGQTVVDEFTGTGDIEIIYTGLRHGEKLFEELVLGADPKGTQHPLISTTKEDYLAEKKMNMLLENLKKATNQQNHASIISLLTDNIEGFNHTGDIVDHLSSITLKNTVLSYQPLQNPRLVS